VETSPALGLWDHGGMTTTFRRSALPTLILLLVAACSSTPGDSPTTTSVATTEPTTTAAPTTTTSVATTSTEASTTTLAATTGPVLRLAGSTVVYTPTGEVHVEGWVEGPASVTVGGVDAETYDNPDARTDFWADLTMDVGTSDVEVVATAPDGSTSSRTVRIVTDPSFVRQFAFITAVEPETSTVVADYAEWYTGDEAAAAAIEDGEGSGDGTYDLDFYIRNQNDRLRTLDVATGTEVALIACYPNEDGPCVTTESVGLVTFADLLDQPGTALDTEGWNWYGTGEAPFWLTISEGVVIQIDEQYLP
jgi:hypothetical protein